MLTQYVIADHYLLIEQNILFLRILGAMLGIEMTTSYFLITFVIL